MVATTYGFSSNATTQTAAPGKSWLRRFLAAMIESRELQARREIHMHTELMPFTLDKNGNRLVKTGTGNMPFGGY